MRRNLKRYYQAWELHKQGKTYKDIGSLMKISPSRTHQLDNYVRLKIKYKKNLPKELIDLVKKYSK